MRHTNKLLLLDEISRMSAFGGKADIAIALRNACLWHFCDMARLENEDRFHLGIGRQRASAT
jgi:hypothetical protein